MYKAVLIVLLLPFFAFTPCKMKYKEHYRITSIQLELLKLNGQNKFHEPIMDPAKEIAGNDTILLFLRFGTEFFSTGVKTRSFPQYGSLGPVDTIQSLHILMKTSESEPLKLDSSLSNSGTGHRVELSSPLPLPGYYTCVGNPFVSFSSIPDFITKYNTRQNEVLFEELRNNGLILGLNTSAISSDSLQQTVNFIVTLELTSGRTFTDTTSAIILQK